MRKKIYKAVAAVATVMMWLWTGSKCTFDWIGRSTVEEDAPKALGLIERALEWLFNTPWWVPTSSAVVLTVLIIILAFGTTVLTIRVEVDSGSDKTKEPESSGVVADTTAQLTEIRNQTFVDEPVILDGRRYISCTFVRCTVQWDGGEFDVVDPKWEEHWAFGSSHPLIIRTVRILNWLKLLRPEGILTGTK